MKEDITMSLPNIPDHPAIQNCERTGYPNREKRETCSRCGKIAIWYSDNNGLLCTDCALETWDELSCEDKLFALGFEVVI